MKLLIIIPAKNEERSIAQVIKSIPKSIDKISSVQIIVINDGSSDNTAAAAKDAGAKVITNKKCLGLARSFSRGLSAALKAGADIIVNTDGDNQYDQAEIPKLIKPILNNKADMVIGDRQVKSLEFMKAGNKYGNLLGSWVLRKLTNTKVNDASSGFRAWSREAALQLNINSSHTYTHESIIQAAIKNLVIKNVPISFRERQTGSSRLISGLFTHIKRSLLTIIRAILMYKPLSAMLYFGAIIALPGLLLGLRFLYFYSSGQGTGKIQSLILAVLLIMIGFFISVLGLLGDLISCNRKLNEEILYCHKKQLFKK